MLLIIIESGSCAIWSFLSFIKDVFLLHKVPLQNGNKEFADFNLHHDDDGDFFSLLFQVNWERSKQKPQAACIGRSLIIRQLNGSRNFIKTDPNLGKEK